MKEENPGTIGRGAAERGESLAARRALVPPSLRAPRSCQCCRTLLYTPRALFAQWGGGVSLLCILLLCSVFGGNVWVWGVLPFGGEGMPKFLLRRLDVAWH